MSSIAFVGWTDPEDDFSILIDCYEILKPLKITRHDFIDLNKGRDFLKEDKTYDIIVLIYIFLYSSEEMKDDGLYHPNDPLTKTSPLHTKENWRKRLLASQAKDILIFGLYEDSEITGKYIGNLSGYVATEIELRRSDTIYKRVWRYEYKDINY
jgi:hypothetical protein